MRIALHKRDSSLGTDFAHRYDRDHPSAAGRPGRRVLVESPDGAEAMARVKVLEMAGFDVSWCPGPEGSEGGHGRCPVMHDERCALLEWADVVVTSLGIENEVQRSLLDAVVSRHPCLPVVVEATGPSAEAHPLLLGGLDVIEAPTTSASLVQAVTSALTRRSPMP